MKTFELIKPEVFFHEQVKTACNELKTCISAEIEFYLVNLLCDFVSFTQTDDFLDTPLALQLKKGLESQSKDQLKILKDLGDLSLYLSGFFQEYFTRKSYDIDYYISIGSHAYNTIARVQMDKHFSAIYKDLSSEFSNLVQIVATISDNRLTTKDSCLITLYEKWARTGSKRLERILEEKGIPLDKGNMKCTQ